MPNWPRNLVAGEVKNVPGPDELPKGPEGEEEAAQQESAAIAARTLDNISKRKDHTRKESFRDHVAIGAVFILWVLMGSTAISIFAVAWHSLAPWPWLSDTQQTSVRAFVFSGAVVATIGGYFRKYLD